MKHFILLISIFSVLNSYSQEYPQHGIIFTKISVQYKNNPVEISGYQLYLTDGIDTIRPVFINKEICALLPLPESFNPSFEAGKFSYPWINLDSSYNLIFSYNDYFLKINSGEFYSLQKTRLIIQLDSGCQTFYENKSSGWMKGRSNLCSIYSLDLSYNYNVREVRIDGAYYYIDGIKISDRYAEDGKIVWSEFLNYWLPNVMNLPPDYFFNLSISKELDFYPSTSLPPCYENQEAKDMVDFSFYPNHGEITKTEFNKY